MRALLKEEQGKTSETEVVKKFRNLSLRNITMGKTVTIEKEKDIDELLQSLKRLLMKELGDHDDTVINLLM
jgi:hypothetical protein